MTPEELDARLRNIERLLTVLIAHPSHQEAVNLMRADVYEEIGPELNRMFPSDPGYRALDMELRGFNGAADEAADLANRVATVEGL